MSQPANDPAVNEEHPDQDAVVGDGLHPHTTDVSSDLDFEAIRDDYLADQE